MKASRTTAIAAGALALTATTLLAGCGGKPSEATAASTPAAAEPAAADVPTSVTDGVEKPAGASDEAWTTALTILAQMDGEFAGATPEELAKACDEFGPSNKEAIAEQVASDAKDIAEAAGGSVEEWTAVYGRFYDNARLLACSMAE